VSTAEAAGPSAVHHPLAARRLRTGASRWADLVPLLAYGAVAFLIFLPALITPNRRIIGWPGDAQQTMWFLRWTPWAISHGQNPLLTTHLNHPAGVNLMWNSLAPVLGVVLWPVSAAAGLVVSYNLLVGGEIVLAAWCAYLAIRRLVRSRAAAACGGLMYGFSPYLMAHAHGHAKVSFALLPPLLLILLHEILVVQRRRAWLAGTALGALLTTQLLIYEEGVVLALVAGGAGVAVLALTNRSELRRRRSHALRALLWAGATACVLATFPLAVQLLGPNHLSGTVPGGDVYVTDVANLVVPTDFQMVAPPPADVVSRRFSGNEVENAAYLGVPLLATVAVVALRRRSQPVVRWALATGGVLLLLSMGPQLHVGGHVSRLPLPWRALQAIPLLGSALPGRLFVYVDLLAGLLLAVFVQAAVRSPRGRGRWVTAVGLLGLCIVTLAPRLPFPSSAVEVPSFFTGTGVAAVPPGSVVLVAPFVHDGPSDPPMLWQAVADMRFSMPEGYFIGVRPGGVRVDGPRRSLTASLMIAIQSGHTPRLTPPLRSRVIAELGRWHVGTVIVGPMPHEDLMHRFVTDLLATSPRKVGGVLVWARR
jgi:hypothetical protein